MRTIDLVDLLNEAQCFIDWIGHLNLGDRNECWLGRNGGYLIVSLDAEGELGILAKLGVVDPSKAAKYREYAQAKNLVLRHNPSAPSSVEAGFIAGGIRTSRGLRLAFSGLPSEGDEALVVFIAFRLKYMKREEAEGLLERHCNTFGSWALAQIMSKI